MIDGRGLLDVVVAGTLAGLVMVTAASVAILGVVRSGQGRREGRTSASLAFGALGALGMLVILALIVLGIVVMLKKG